jgi:hypothetical protein
LANKSTILRTFDSIWATDYNTIRPNRKTLSYSNEPIVSTIKYTFSST